jgi:hypothetical protein
MKRCKLVDFKYLEEKHWTPPMIGESLARLDKLYYPDYQPDVDFLSRTSVSRSCCRGYLFDEFHNEIVGFWSIFSIGESLYQKIVNGFFDESNFKIDHAALPPFKGEVYLYIGTLMLHHEYRTMANFKLMVATMLAKLVELIKAGCVICGLVTFGYTEIGKKLCEGFGLNSKVKDRHLGIAYEIDFNKTSNIPEIAKPLYELIKIKNELESFDEESGLPIVKDILKKWGYKVDGI